MMMKKKQRDSPPLISVDIDNLDNEWVKQPTRVHRCGISTADAKKDVAEAKVEMEVVEAEVKQHIRENPADYGYDKRRPSEDALKELVRLDKRFQKAQQSYINTKHILDLTEAKMEALRHKKGALESLVYVVGNMIFGAPRGTPESSAKRSIRRGQ